jgi:transcriptional regulator GlxA family with amidase domain
MTTTIGLLIFDRVEELDFVGPWEVFTMAGECGADLRAVTIAPNGGTVRCAKGLRVIADHGFADAPKLDVLLVPGGEGTRPLATNDHVLNWISATAADCRWITSVCTGALLLAASGVAAGRSLCTHWAFADKLARRGDVTVLADKRFHQDGNIVSAAGVSAGIDMALWLTGQLFGHDLARATQKYMEYDPARPCPRGLNRRDRERIQPPMNADERR